MDVASFMKISLIGDKKNLPEEFYNILFPILLMNLISDKFLEISYFKDITLI